jgi:hypothetical protein
LGLVAAVIFYQQRNAQPLQYKEQQKKR